MLRVWTEHLDYSDARDSDVLDLLERGDLHPIVAVRPDSDLEELAGLLGDLENRGRSTAIWPLLSYEAGYWPSDRNAEQFARRVRGYLDELESAGVVPDLVAFDLEPAYQKGEGVLDSVVRSVRRSIRREDAAAAYARSLAVYRDLVAELGVRGIGTLGVTFPMAAADLGRSNPFWQRLLGTPWSPISWDRAGVMAYGSLTAGLSGGTLRYSDVRALHYQVFLYMRRHLSAGVHASLGLTGTGVFGDEPSYDRPEEIRRDVAAARAAGVDDIAIFCLEGVLETSRPETWIDAISNAEPAVPRPTVRAEAVLASANLLTEGLSGWVPTP